MATPECLAQVQTVAAAPEDMTQHLQVLFSRALLKSARGQHAEAVLLWRQLRTLEPNDMEIQTAWGQSEQAAQFAMPEEAADTKAPAKPGDHILAGFTSLGQDCEFGLLQRHFGVEPRGLLRGAAPAAFAEPAEEPVAELEAIVQERDQDDPSSPPEGSGETCVSRAFGA